ncbi:Gfo/Idh/MocA family protein [Kineococcus xinjiangensis]|uniref:Gfo/Idh/MocA family protein n=1 Tax=Kineococcus xinjiangensis TaxID=512762 RepID=UPI000CEC9662
MNHAHDTTHDSAPDTTADAGPLRVGIVGCGHISTQYLATLARLPELAVTAAADLDPARAQAVAAAHPGVRALGIADLLAADDVDVVLNLTVPAAHAEVALAAIAAGRDVYGEKPLAATTAEAARVVAAAEAAGVRLGCAPDTVLGSGLQTARRVLDDGLLGAPVAATATMLTPGHERWHPDPDFYYAPGGGPLLDMGPYYVSALVSLLGPVVSAVGAASHTRTSRTIGRGPRAGERVPVTTDTHVTGVLTHASGALSTLVMSFDAVATRGSSIEVHGERGSLVVPDPNHFDGDVLLHPLGGDGWQLVPVSAGYRAGGRGIGLLDLAERTRREPRASGRVGLHVLDVLESLLDSAARGRRVDVAGTCERPDPVPLRELHAAAPASAA